MKRALLLLLLLAGQLPAKESDAQQLPRALFRSSYELLSALPATATFSPYCLDAALGLAYVGSAGETATGIQKALQLPYSTKEAAGAFRRLQKQLLAPRTQKEMKPLFRMATGLWASSETFFLQNYRKAAEEAFAASVETIDFHDAERAALQINSWISGATESHVPSLLTPQDLSPDARLVLTTAAHFQGNWLHPFAKDQTLPAPFFLADGETREVMMMQKRLHIPYAETPTFRLAALPLERKGEFALVLFLPSEVAPLSELKESGEAIFAALSNLQETALDLQLPRFSLRSRADFAGPLGERGMKAAFSRSADFSGIDGMRDLYISGVFHEAYIAVDEAGVVASAATAIPFRPTAVHPPEEKVKPFIVNHPFLFFIVHLPTKAVLFLGKMSEPAL